MRKCIYSALMILCLALSACGSTTQQRLQSYCAPMAQAQAMTVTAKVQANFDETIESYTIQYSFDGEKWTAYVTEPPFVSGIVAHISDSGSQLEFDGMILSTGDLTERGITPIGALPMIYDAIGSGLLDSAWEEGTLTAGTFVYDDDVSVSVWFDEGGMPTAAELTERGIVKARCMLEDARYKE